MGTMVQHCPLVDTYALTHRVLADRWVLSGWLAVGMASGFGRNGHVSLLRHTLASVVLVHSWDVCSLLIHLLLSTETFSWLK